MNIKNKIKNFIKDIIIVSLLILLILSKIDFQINMINKNNWIDIILCMITVISTCIFSLLIYLQANSINKRQEKFEIDILQKQLDSDLRKNRMEIYNTFMSLGFLERTFNIRKIILNFISANHNDNSTIYNSLFEKEKEVTLAICNSKILFDNDDTIYLKNEKLFDLIVEYRNNAQKFLSNLYVANIKAIEYLNSKNYKIETKWIPKDIIDTDRENFDKVFDIFMEYTDKLQKISGDIFSIVTDENYIKLYDKYINIELKGGIL